MHNPGVFIMWNDRYNYDCRVDDARAMRDFRAMCDERRMVLTFTQESEEGEEVSFTLPIRFEVCHVCNGRGTHVNPSIDAGGIHSDDEFWADDRDEETGESRYFSGFYDVTCYTCGGRNVVPAVDERGADKATLAVWHARLTDEADYEAICRAERRMGC